MKKSAEKPRGWQRWRTALAVLPLILSAAAPPTPAAAPSLQQPCSTRVSIEGPRSMVEGYEAQYTALVNGSDEGFSFRWRVSAGDIIRGRNERQMTVRMPRGAGASTVVASVAVRHRGQDCRPRQQQTVVLARNRHVIPNQPPVVQLVANTAEVVVCPDRPESARPCGATVKLSATATDPDGDTLLYTYSTTGGRIIGSGSETFWDLSGLEPGTYTATVEVTDGNEEEETNATVFSQTTVSVRRCEPTAAP